jgi:hypothetical protein
LLSQKWHVFLDVSSSNCNSWGHCNGHQWSAWSSWQQKKALNIIGISPNPEHCGKFDLWKGCDIILQTQHNTVYK